MSSTVIKYSLLRNRPQLSGIAWDQCLRQGVIWRCDLPSHSHNAMGLPVTCK